ncbi:hypothetical protein IEQ34_006489 [Dendrobium chrysotoxum]|uniref:Uncharacterized protein n=1 Tax=Dendrobium chrysotoxum TaxID=161865 RepID=A0AAV7HCQ6_DENCH|nr:hypothetical protein IEQ34_006489 [Dendrobium chrysotoxum]
MALDSWLTKMRSAISTSLQSVRSTMIPDTTATATTLPLVSRRKENVSILAFEVAGLMSKLLQLWLSLSDASLSRLRNDTIALPGVQKFISSDENFLLSLACADLIETLCSAAASTSALTRRCADPALRQFDLLFKDFADSDCDPYRWTMTWKEMETKAKKMNRYVTATAALYKEMDELAEAERGLRKLCSQAFLAGKVVSAADAQQRIFWQRQEVQYLKQRASLWCCTFDSAVSLLARSSFTILARIKQVFGINDKPTSQILSAAAVHPANIETPAKKSANFLETSSAMLIPPGTTLGAAALAAHYASLIVMMERMMREPKAVGREAREELYGILPWSVRALLRARLKGMSWVEAPDAGLAAEWRVTMRQIIDWLGPIAHGTIRWQGESSFERRSAAVPRANVLLLQTLYFANREKVEAAIVELLVGLNYVWRFELCQSLEA